MSIQEAVLAGVRNGARNLSESIQADIKLAILSERLEVTNTVGIGEENKPYAPKVIEWQGGLFSSIHVEETQNGFVVKASAPYSKLLEDGQTDINLPFYEGGELTKVGFWAVSRGFQETGDGVNLRVPEDHDSYPAVFSKLKDVKGHPYMGEFSTAWFKAQEEATQIIAEAIASELREAGYVTD